MKKSLENLIKENTSCGEEGTPIDDFKLDNCYTPNGETYPLCKGQLGNKLCKNCNVYENMAEPYDNN